MFLWLNLSAADSRKPFASNCPDFSRKVLVQWRMGNFEWAWEARQRFWNCYSTLLATTLQAFLPPSLKRVSPSRHWSETEFAANYLRMSVLWYLLNREYQHSLAFAACSAYCGLLWIINSWSYVKTRLGYHWFFFFFCPESLPSFFFLCFLNVFWCSRPVSALKQNDFSHFP